VFFKEIFFPTSCLLCGKLGPFLCLACQKELILYEKNICFYCKKQSLFGLTHPPCKRKNGIDGSIFIYRYNNSMKKIIKKIKYRLVKNAFINLLKISSDHIYKKLKPILKLYNNMIIIPIPLHKTRLNIRGFNQTEIITGFLTKYFRLKETRCLVKQKNTKTQATLKSKKDRLFNIKGAFLVSANANIINRNCILIDDVVTSGSTVKEACIKLKQKGANKVFIFALAKG
jgi:ComF family protein